CARNPYQRGAMDYW
nr:immunoglobulin heavy chain junction region [Mus musculus]